MWSSISVFCSRQTRTSGDERVRRSCCLHVYLLPPSGQNKPKRLFQARFLSFHLERNQIFTIRGLEQKYKSKQSGGAAFVGDVILYLSSSSAQLTCAVLHSHLQDSKSNHIYWELMAVNSFKTLCMCSIRGGCSRRSFEWFFVSPTHPALPSFYWGLSSRQRKQRDQVNAGNLTAEHNRLAHLSPHSCFQSVEPRLFLHMASSSTALWEAGAAKMP